MTTLNSNEHRIIIAALETYQSMWAVAVTEAQRENEPIDERFTRERYVEAGELLAKFKAEPEGAVAMIGKLDANVAAEQVRDRERLDREIAAQPRGTVATMETAKGWMADPAEALRHYYALPGRGNGGAVHIITEDGNVAQEYADWCVENAPKWTAEFGGDALLAEDLRIARMLAAMTDAQRQSLYETGNFYPEEPSDRAILDHLDHNLDDLRSADEEGEES